VTSDANLSGQTEARVFTLRPRVGRRSATVNSIVGAAQSVPPVLSDLAEFERPPGKDDYWHRMAVNIAALAFTVMLVVVGVWLADTIAMMRKNQDCVLMGRPSCTQVTVPSNTRP
jgi:hypothetical protein